MKGALVHMDSPSTASREQELALQVDRLRIQLELARHDLQLADERAQLQRLHIAQLQNQLGIGVCRPDGQPVLLQTPAAPAPPPPAAVPALREAIAPPDDRPAKRPGWHVPTGQVPIDPDRLAIGMCQNAPCEEEVNHKNGRYCSSSCAMKHRWAHRRSDAPHDR